MTHVMIYAVAIAIGLTTALAAMVVYTIGEFAVMSALTLLGSIGSWGGGGGIAGVAVTIPSPLSPVAAVVGFVFGFRWTVRKARHAAR